MISGHNPSHACAISSSRGYWWILRRVTPVLLRVNDSCLTGYIRMRLKGKAAIVTGAARGIGRTCALRPAREGARLAIADVLDGTTAAQEITGTGGEALFVRTDVFGYESSDESDVITGQTIIVDGGKIFH